MGQINMTEINYGPSASERLFILFLFVAVCIVIVRLFRMGWCLWSIRKRQEFSSFTSLDAQSIAKAALKGLFKKEPEHTTNAISVASIETKFLFLWETCNARIQSTKTIAILTVVLSFCVAALGFVNICNGLMTEETSGPAAVGASGREVFTVLAIGLFVSAFFYSISLLFEGTLARRRRDWNYFVAKIREDSIPSDKSTISRPLEQ